MLGQVLDGDSWIGEIRRFPTILHARASLAYDVTTVTLQKSLILSLKRIQESRQEIEVSLSDRKGYLEGTVGFKVGIGNDSGFDILDSAVEDKVLRKIIAQGPLPILDFGIDMRYRIQSPTRHRVAIDRYLTRFTFGTGKLELLVHHLQGLRRLEPGDLVQLLLSAVNNELASRGYQPMELEESMSD